MGDSDRVRIITLQNGEKSNLLAPECIRAKVKR